MPDKKDAKKDAKKAREKAEKDGKPFDEKKFIEGKCKMAPVAAHLSKLLGKPVALSPDCLSKSIAADPRSRNCPFGFPCRRPRSMTPRRRWNNSGRR